MIGDQLATDIHGAHAFGLDSVMVSSGITKREAIKGDNLVLPTYVMPSVIHEQNVHCILGPIDNSQDS